MWVDALSSAVALLALLCGCASTQESGLTLLETSFEGLNFQAAHGEYLVLAELAPDAPREAAVERIVAFLDRQGHGGTHIPSPDANLDPPLRQRDFWALVLAKLTERPFALYLMEDFESRDRKIDALVTTVGGHQGRYGSTGTLLRAERIHLALLSECLERRLVCRYEGALARTDLRGVVRVHETGEWSVWPLPMDPREKLVPKDAVLVRFALAPPPADLCLVGDQDPDSLVPELGCSRREFIRLVALRAESPDVLEYLPPPRSPPW